MVDFKLNRLKRETIIFYNSSRHNKKKSNIMKAPHVDIQVYYHSRASCLNDINYVAVFLSRYIHLVQRFGCCFCSFCSFGEWTAFSDEPIDDNLTYVVSNQLFLFFADKFAFRRWLNITKVLSGMNICCLGVDSFF